MCFSCLFLDLHLTTPLKYSCAISKSDHERPAYHESQFQHLSFCSTLQVLLKTKDECNYFIYELGLFFCMAGGRWRASCSRFWHKAPAHWKLMGLLVYLIIWQYIYYGYGQIMGENRRGKISLWQTGDPKAKCQGLEFRISTLRYENFQSTFIRVTPALSCTLVSSLTKEVVVMRDLSFERYGWRIHRIPSPLDLQHSMALSRILYGLLCFKLHAFWGLLCHSFVWPFYVIYVM